MTNEHLSMADYEVMTVVTQRKKQPHLKVTIYKKYSLLNAIETAPVCVDWLNVEKFIAQVVDKIDDDTVLECDPPNGEVTSFSS